MERGRAYYTWDEEAGAWYFGLAKCANGPYLIQQRVEAIIDLDDHGRLVGVELLEPIKPSRGERERS